MINLSACPLSVFVIRKTCTLPTTHFRFDSHSSYIHVHVWKSVLVTINMYTSIGSYSPGIPPSTYLDFEVLPKGTFLRLLHVHYIMY